MDLVIVVDRLLTGFDAPCLSTIYIDRQPMGPHDLIQAFSRTNRIYDTHKTYGQIVTFQAPRLFKECVDEAVKLYSAGSSKEVLVSEWEEIEPQFKRHWRHFVLLLKSRKMSQSCQKREERLCKDISEFRQFICTIKSFTRYEESKLKGYGITEEEYIDYAGHYLNVLEELKQDKQTVEMTRQGHSRSMKIMNLWHTAIPKLIMNISLV